MPGYGAPAAGTGVALANRLRTPARQLIAVRAVNLRHGDVAALQGIDLCIDAGERVALVGSNGSGKSSLLRLLGGLLVPHGGTVQRDTALRQAMVFQHPFMLRASVRANVALGLWLAGVGWRAAAPLAQAALARVGMAALAGRNASTLSGGQKQRVALARAWALQPRLWLLDEPTASLDPHAKREVESLLADFAASQPEPCHPGYSALGMGNGASGHNADAAVTMVFASHNLGQVKRLASRVVYLERGRILADLPCGEFFDAERLQAVSHAAHLFVKGELA